MKVEINKLQKKEEIPFFLLLLADPSLEKIKSYLPVSSIFIAKYNHVKVGCYVLSEVEENSCEIKNIAIHPEYQRKGLGQILIHDAISRSRKMGYKKLMIGTGNSSIWQLYLYQKMGFRISGIKSDYFVHNYKDPIFENGLQCRDLIELSIAFVD